MDIDNHDLILAKKKLYRSSKQIARSRTGNSLQVSILSYCKDDTQH